MPTSPTDPTSTSFPLGSLPGSSPLAPMASRNRRSSMASGDSPFRARRTSLSTNQPPSPSLNLAAAASVNASMRAGSPGPANTARDSVDMRRKSVVADLMMADDSLPPPAEIATGDRKPSLADGMYRIPSLSLKETSSASPAVSPSPFDRSRASLSGSPRMTGVEPTKPSMNTADPFHKRTPSVGEVHQQMEQEQEAQVNRLLLQIHQQQMQIEALKHQNGTPTMSSAASIVDSDSLSQPALTPTATPTTNPIRPPPTPERAHSSGSASTTTASTMPAARVSPTMTPVTRPARSGSPMSLSLQRRSSSRGSRPSSPSTKNRAQGGYLEADETKYWQTEASNLERENAILKSRIRELEKQARTANGGEGEHSTAPHRSSSLATESMNIDG